MIPDIPPLDYWPPLPEGETGVQIRYRKIHEGRVRLGGACPIVVVVETEYHVVYRVYGSDGRFLTEKVMGADEFEQTFERRPAEREWPEPAVKKRYRPVRPVQSTRIYVGEQDITNQVAHVRIDREWGEPETAVLTVHVEPLHVDADGTLIITIPTEG